MNEGSEEFYSWDGSKQPVIDSFVPYDFPLIAFDNYSVAQLSSFQASEPSQFSLLTNDVYSVSSTPSTNTCYYQPQTPVNYNLSDQTKLTHSTESSNNNLFIPVYVVPNHLKNEQGRYMCQQCNKTYIQIKHLKRHLLKHTGQKPYKCKHCEQTFFRSDSKFRHMAKCKMQKGPKTELCKNPPSLNSTNQILQPTNANLVNISTNYPNFTFTSTKQVQIPSTDSNLYVMKTPCESTAKPKLTFNDDTSNIFKVSARYTNNPAAYAATKAIFKCVPQKPSIGHDSTTLDRNNLVACQSQFQLNVKKL